MVVEDISFVPELDKRIKDLSSIRSQQMEIDLLSKIIDLANQEYKTDLKKIY
ncbi:MAG: hypothetical protein IPL22_15535 [Bacteroidetes bacterium]|nr:hypothetical protein [Bacteroidota bacterium]